MATVVALSVGASGVQVATADTAPPSTSSSSEPPSSPDAASGPDAPNLGDFTQTSELGPGESPELKQLDLTDADLADTSDMPAADEDPATGDDTTYDDQAANSSGRPNLIAEQLRLAATGPDAVEAKTCGCNNKPQIKSAMKLMGIRYFRLKNFVGRLGKTYGKDVYDSFVLFSNKNAATMRKVTPYPNRLARSATHEPSRSALYNVYEIYYRHLGPEYNPDTWKFGITRQTVARERPQRQIPACIKWAKARGLLDCGWDWVYQDVPGWFLARVLESTLITMYGITHRGGWPPGNPVGL